MANRDSNNKVISKDKVNNSLRVINRDKVRDNKTKVVAVDNKTVAVEVNKDNSKDKVRAKVVAVTMAFATVVGILVMAKGK